MQTPTNSLMKQLRELRRQQGLSQTELASRIGIPQSHLSKIEAARVDPRCSAVIELARALDHELVVIPKSQLSLIESLLSGGETQTPAYRLDTDEDDTEAGDE